MVVLTFLIYGADKWKARWRIPEHKNVAGLQKMLDLRHT